VIRSELRLLTAAVAGLLAGPLAPAFARVQVTDELAGALAGAQGAGRMGRLWQDWIMRPIESVDKEVLRDLRRARRASRELVGTWGPAARWGRLAEEQIVGAQGVRLRVQLTKRDAGGNEIPDLERNRRIERAWFRWTRPDLCDVAGKWSFPTHERVFVKTWARDGEALLRMVEGFPNAYGFALQALDPDQLDDRLNIPAGRQQNEIRGGVEVNAWGQPVAYHVYTSHPNDLWHAQERQRVPAGEILHWYEPARAGQSRGLPRLLSALVAAKMTAGYEEAEVTAARSNAIRMGFYERDPVTANLADPRTGHGEIEDRVFSEGEPGQFGVLPLGWKVTSWAPTHPSSQYAAFVKSMLRSVASGLAVAYNTLANDLEGVNFSSLRSGTLAERDRYQVDQAELIDALHARLFPRWLTWAVTMGHLPPADLEAMDPERFTFQPRGWPWVDPLKDVQTDILAIRAGLSSRTRAAAARGVDIEEVFQELRAEKQLAESLGLKLETDLAGRPIDETTDDTSGGGAAGTGGNDGGA